MRDAIQKAIDFALAKEIEAEAFYKEWAENASSTAVKALFAELAAAENGHAEMLRRIRPDEIIAAGSNVEGRAGLVDFLEEIDPDPSMGIQEAMILAMKREATSVALYERLADFGGEAEALLRGLANEERKHRDRLEAEYNEHVMTEG